MHLNNGKYGASILSTQCMYRGDFIKIFTSKGDITMHLSKKNGLYAYTL